MTQRFPAHTAASATGAAADRLAELERRHGDVGTMVRTMAGSPSVLTGYLDLSRAMKRSRLDRALSERLSLAVQARLGCATCLDAHADAARALGISESEIDRARRATSSDPRTAAILDFGRRVHADPASITDEDVASLRALGLRDRDILDIVGLVALNVLTGSFNLVAGVGRSGDPLAVFERRAPGPRT